ncbi:GumC family protein [Leptothoe spongobia]|uniref:non-specific protein-tyrosine kinase n=1 Tax=Leptothoe spongobia TAU-MAC 1115 TaxID=1967444 RepID=A0A947DIC9_9CYAN|nr:polysaccharide biosynthesis tyrosine autokinase [Leptothoe spongobia]MBT9317208.1 polysaccharide biosynthesis tyrosine autokinase [Leptothoe spongobia TAU-MAC 1115]
MVKTLVSLKTVLKRRGWLALPIVTSAMGAALLYLLVTPPTYRASSQIIVNDKDTSVSDLGQGLTKIGTNAPGIADPIATQSELIRSQSVLKKALFAFKDGPEDLPSTKGLRKAVDVEILPATNILRVTVEHQDPELTARLANEIANATVSENIAAIQQEAKVVREFLEVKIPQQKLRLREAEDAEGRYRQISGIVALESQTQQLVNRQAGLETERSQILSQLESTVTENQQLQALTETPAPEAAYNDVRVGQNQELQTLEQEITALNVTMADEATRLGEQHPDWLALLEKRQSLEGLYQAKLESLSTSADPRSADAPLSQDLLGQYINSNIRQQSLASQLSVIDSELADISVQLLDLPIQQQPLASLIRAREQAAKTLESMQSKLSEATLAEAQLVSNVRIIGEAEIPKNPVAPKPAVVLLLALISGAALSVALAAVLEGLDSTLRTPEEVESELKLPVIGMLPKLSHRYDAHRLNLFLAIPEQVEPYRALLKALSAQQYSLGNGKTLSNGNGNAVVPKIATHGQTIVVTSPFIQDSKSSVALHLAATAAMLSKKTLLIDADFWASSKDSLLQSLDYPGLTAALEDPTQLSSIAQATDVGNLFVLPHKYPVNLPGAVVESQAMQSLIAAASSQYDVVIIDTAPSTKFTDASTLSRYSDGLLLVLRSGVSQHEASASTALELRRGGTHILGVALDNVSSGTRRMSRNFDSEHLHLIEYSNAAVSADESRNRHLEKIS